MKKLITMAIVATCTTTICAKEFPKIFASKFPKSCNGMIILNFKAKSLIKENENQIFYLKEVYKNQFTSDDVKSEILNKLKEVTYNKKQNKLIYTYPCVTDQQLQRINHVTQ